MTKTAHRMVLDCVASIPPDERAAHIQEFRRLATKRRGQGLHLLGEMNAAVAARLELEIANGRA